MQSLFLKVQLKSMFKYTPHTLKKIEGILKEAGYSIRYEKGHFKAGYCILENKMVVVVNRYYTLEAKINSLIEILNRIELNRDQLSDQSQKVLVDATTQKTGS